MENIKVTLALAEVKSTTVKYAEKNADPFRADLLGDLYLPKSTVAELVIQKGYTCGDLIVEIGNTGDIKLMPELPAKAMTVKFIEEVGEGAMAEIMPKKLGNRIYIPRSTLEKLGYRGDALYISLIVPETTAE